jgi:hypothetical protein
MNNSPPRTESATETGLPKISPGAQELIGIAYRKDTEGTLALNRPLGLCLQHIAQLPSLCRQADRRQLWLLIKQTRLPDTFFGFCAALANAIDLLLAEPMQGPPAGRRAPIEITHSVYLALGQALAEASRDPMKDPSPMVPNLDVALERLAAKDPGHLQHLLILHFLGNVLQDFFDSCQVRMQIPKLPFDSESNLREIDARKIADELFRRVPPGPGGAEAGMLQDELRNMLDWYSHDTQNKVD